MSKTSKRKAGAKAAKPPVDHLTFKAKKGVGGDTTKKTTLSARLPRRQANSARDLWKHIFKTAEKLHRSVSLGASVDYARVREVLLLLLLTLRHAATNGDATAAITTLFGATKTGRLFLHQLSLHKNSREALKAFASGQPNWIVEQSLQQSSHQANDELLRQISVGTASDPPTARMKATAEGRWRSLASKFVGDIKRYQFVLKLPALKWKSSSSTEQAIIDAELIEAKKYPEIGNLPETLNVKSRAAYWAVVKKMLKEHWKSHPADKRADFEKVKLSAKHAGERPEVFATRQVRQVYQAMVGKTSPDV